MSGFEALKAQAIEVWQSRRRPDQTQIIVGMSTCGIAAGAAETMSALREALDEQGVRVLLSRTSCIGMCYLEPLVDIVKPGWPRITYGKVTPKIAQELVRDCVAADNPRPDLAVGIAPPHGYLLPEEVPPGFVVPASDNGFDIPGYGDLPFLKSQMHLVLRRCGFIDPESIEEYIATGGYSGLAKVLSTMTPDEVIDLVGRSGLRGRGGAGFPTARKWKASQVASGRPKYMLCNGDEGDPGAFMNRSEMEGDPHAVIEGMIIAAYAIGAEQGYMYVRAEYPLAVKRLAQAIRQAEANGFLGKDILGSGFDFSIRIKRGAGAFVCGESTALMYSIEGKRGMPRSRPPQSAERGLWGKPTVLNNVETLANVPLIVNRGADWFASIGSESSKGTKVFSLTGKIKRPGLVEVPMGITLGEIIFDIGGGIVGDREFKAAQTGGPSGGCVFTDHLDLRLDYESLEAVGSMMGSGGLVIMDEDTCMVDVACFFTHFNEDESCGKCSTCCLGTQRMGELLDRICAGEGHSDDIAVLETLGDLMAKTTLCGLGQTAPNPVLSTIRYFRAEYEAHIFENRCPARVCKALISFCIVADNCPGCTACVHQCPVDAISGTRKEPHIIDQSLCTKCGACFATCKFDAIVVE